MTTQRVADSVAEARDFTYITPRGRRLSEYEAVNLYIQPVIENGWDLSPCYLKSPQGRDAWELGSTALRHPHWHDFRDPSNLWQRPYMRMQAEQERAIERMTQDVALGDVDADIDATWLREIIAGHYAVWSFVEWGLFRALFPASREALSDTVAASMLFETFDRARHSQDIVHYLLMLEEQVPGFDARPAKDIWLESPRYQPLRKMVEELAFLVRDWGESIVAVNLVFDPIVTEVVISSLVGYLAPFHGDVVSRAIIASAERDRSRSLAWTREFVGMVTAPGVPAASDNRDLIAGWVTHWRNQALRVVEPFEELYKTVPFLKRQFSEVLADAVSEQQRLIGELGISAVRR